MTTDTTRRQRRNQAQWQALINEQQSSGLTAMAFCQANDLGYASFNRWKSRLSGTVPEASGVSHDQGFIDLSALPSSSSDRWQITLKLDNGMELQLVRC